MASNTTELPGNDFFGKDFLGSVVKYGGLDRGSNTQAAKYFLLSYGKLSLR